MQLSLTSPLPLVSPRLTRRLLPLFIAAFSQGLVLWAPIEKVFLNGLGFDQAALGLMAACYTSLIPLFDLDSGILADRWSRKGILILASIASMLNALLGGLSYNVPTYLVSTLFFGVEVALVSGTYESILYDTLLEETGGSHAFEQRLSQVKLLSSLALIIGSLAGGLVATVLSPRLAYFATIPLVALSLFALRSFQEPSLHHAEARHSLSSHLRSSAATLFQPGKNRQIILVLLATSLLLSVIFEFGPLWQLALAAPVGLYGLSNAAVLTAGGAGSLLAPRLSLAKPASILVMAGLLVGASLALVIVQQTVVVILAQGVLVAGGTGISMVFTGLLHDALSSRVRAGAASGVGALSSTAFVLFSLLFGMVSQHAGIFHAGWMVVGVALLVCVLLVKGAVDQGFNESNASEEPEGSCAA
ncbi:MAG TPA: MFS transporter [Ktedonobacterales bacterium]|nr:MFS transporter [Ktedonobacterales bacterium]